MDTYYPSDNGNFASSSSSIERRSLLRSSHQDVEARRLTHVEARSSLISSGLEWVKNVGRDFKSFIDKGSVVSLAIGIIIGESFSAVVTSFVSDIITPIMGLVITSKLSETFLTIRVGPNYPYKTRDEARKDGAVTWNYGNFCQLFLNFLIISGCLFVIVRMIQSMHRKKKETNVTKECPFCYSDMDGRAIKCPSCTADVS